MSSSSPLAPYPSHIPFPLKLHHACCSLLNFQVSPPSQLLSDLTICYSPGKQSQSQHLSNLYNVKSYSVSIATPSLPCPRSTYFRASYCSISSGHPFRTLDSTPHPTTPAILRFSVLPLCSTFPGTPTVQFDDHYNLPPGFGNDFEFPMFRHTHKN